MARSGRATFDQPFVTGRQQTAAGPVPQVGTRLTRADRWGGVWVRWSIGRDDYRVTPGLYALGRPDGDSPVLVTASYKLTFDLLRRSLGDLAAWILVLDTDGINVWCAAGKGTFGTDELVRRIESSNLAAVVSHRRLLLPQLGAPGVAAHEVKSRTGFRVIYGPVRASDLPAFLAARRKATAQMRRVRFGLWDRLTVVPVELVGAMKHAAPVALALLLLGGLGGPAPYSTAVWQHGLPAALAIFAAVLAGTVLTPVLLPWLPGRAFAVKGLWPSLGLAGALFAIAEPDLAAWSGRLELAAWVLLTMAAGTFLALNFTGATTFTSLSGVRREIRVAVPAQLAAALVGLVLWAVGRAVA